jgi:hypothetical protein
MIVHLLEDDLLHGREHPRRRVVADDEELAADAGQLAGEVHVARHVVVPDAERGHQPGEIGGAAGESGVAEVQDVVANAVAHRACSLRT